MADYPYYAAFYQTIGSPKYRLKIGPTGTVEELILWIIGLKEFKATRDLATIAGMPDADIDDAIDELCSIPSLNTRIWQNNQLSVYTPAQVRSFLEHVLATNNNIAVVDQAEGESNPITAPFVHAFTNDAEKTNINTWLRGMNDNRLYVALHGQGSKLFVSRSSPQANGSVVSVPLTTRSLARWIKGFGTPANTEIVLLSCASEQAAQNLVNKLGGAYRVVSWTGEVRVHFNGFIDGDGDCKRYSPASSNTINATVLLGSNIPKGKATSGSGAVVVLAKPIYGCTHFDGVKDAASRVKTATFTDDKIKDAINKLCSKISVADSARIINAQLITYSDATVKSFLEQIIATGDDRHISEHINGNFKVPQLTAWKKLYGSGFETDFEYLRTLVYVGVNACTVTITPNVTKSVTVVHGTFTTTFSDNNITATGATTLASGLNKVLNIHPLIANANYIIESRYKYETDNIGRVVKVTTVIGASLANPTSARVKGSSFYPNEHTRCQTLKGGNIGSTLDDDDAGHLIAAQFNGVPEQINVLPQIRKQNQNRIPGLWRAMELEWKATLNTQTTVSVEIVPIFLGTNRRPESYRVEYVYGTNPPVIKNITNQP